MDETLLALFVASTLRLAAPLLLAAMGELVSERAGVLNLGVEGMMLAGAFFGAWAAHASGSAALGLVAAMTAAACLGAVQAGLCVLRQADQIVVGLGLNVFALGLTTLLSRLVFGARAQTQVPGFEPLVLPGLGQLPFVGPALFQHTALVYLALLVALLTWLLLEHTGAGIALTAAGERPTAADRTGLPVQRVRCVAVLYTSVTCGLAGAFLSLADVRTFVEGMTSGTGFIALVAVIFGNWKWHGVLLACLFFGAATALRFLLPAMQIDVPLAVLAAFPYVAALLALTGAIGRQRPPSALGLPFLARR